MDAVQVLLVNPEQEDVYRIFDDIARSAEFKDRCGPHRSRLLAGNPHTSNTSHHPPPTAGKACVDTLIRLGAADTCSCPWVDLQTPNSKRRSPFPLTPAHLVSLMLEQATTCPAAPPITFAIGGCDRAADTAVARTL